MASVTLTAGERDAVIEWIREDLLRHTAPELFASTETRRRVVDYAEIADELGYDETTSRDTYPVERSLGPLRRVLTEWRDIAEKWLEYHAAFQDRQGSGKDKQAQSELYRLELWAKCESILDRLGED